jgi:YaeQ protein
MALKSTIFKANLGVADIDHGYYADHNLTLARHPSETDERMMVRLVALGLHAHELQTRCNGDATLTFGAGLSDADDPDVVLTDYTGAKRVWIEVGQPEQGLQQGRKRRRLRLRPGRRGLVEGCGDQDHAPRPLASLALAARRRAGADGHGRAQHAVAGDDSRGPCDAVQQQGLGGD